MYVSEGCSICLLLEYETEPALLHQSIPGPGGDKPTQKAKFAWEA